MKGFGVFVSTHFDMLLLVFIFVFSSLMLALFPMRDEMARWIEGGAIITIMARSMGLATKTATPPPSDESKQTKEDNGKSISGK
jgi:hypothetical protein